VFDNLLVAEEKFFSSLDNEGQRYLKKLIKLGRRNGLYIIFFDEFSDIVHYVIFLCHII